MVKYLTFDCYGTLIDWKTGIGSALRKNLGDLRIGDDDLMAAYLQAERAEEETYKSYRDVLSGSATRLSAKLGVPLPSGAAREFAASVPDWPAFKDTRESLRALGSMGFRRYILSNVDDDLLEETIARHGLEVDGFVSAQQVGSYKPRPGHWEEFLRRTGASKGDLLHVAQSIYHDVIPVGKMGIQSAWVNRYGEPLPPEANPEYVSDSLAGLVQALSP
ncbi:MAG TPA: HAD family hydrolase [Nitrososphaerales archaeon]|nr:HAD family hydrolase [Nitrososphaerales archaeon]